MRRQGPVFRRPTRGRRGDDRGRVLAEGRDRAPLRLQEDVGFRGASRYFDERYQEGFALECRTMHKVREVMSLENAQLVVPLCRTVEEGRRVIAEIDSLAVVEVENALVQHIVT